MLASNVVPLKRPKPSNKINLTKSIIDKLPFVERTDTVKQRIYWDTKQPGFGLVVGLTAKTFIVQWDIKGKPTRITIGKYGAYTPQQARAQAEQLIPEMKRGFDPRERVRSEKALKITLRDALKAYKTSRKTLSEKTKTEYTRLFERYLSDWLDKPLTEITPEKVEKRHTRIAEKIRANPRFKNSPNYSGSTKATGQSAANDALRALKTVYNHALAVNDALPPNPVKRLSATKAWFPETRRTGHIKPADLKTWMAAIGNVPSDVQRDYALLVLFTGLRRNEATSIEWSNVDLNAGTLRIPVTKNKRPLDLPLSSYLVALLTARKARCEDSPWVFPADSKSGHIEEPRAALDRAAKESGVAVTVHDLRRTFITIAESCDVPHYVFKALVNHSTAGDVTGSHYVQMSVERMRPWMEKISAEILRLGYPENSDPSGYS